MTADFQAKLLAGYPRSVNFPNEHNCPRGIESGQPGQAIWTADDCCSWCGSLNPDLFMQLIEAGEVKLGPTDKNYKVYVEGKFKQTYRGKDDPGGDDPSKWVWTTQGTHQAKFYFQHLSVEQCMRFITLLNTKKLKIDIPGHFYVLPFFIGR